MPSSGSDPFAIPDAFWQFPETRETLQKRDIGRLLVLVRQHIGATQTQMAVACGATQPKINAIMHGKQRVTDLAVFERYADGLGMPSRVRAFLGLAPLSARDASCPAPGWAGSGQTDAVAAAAGEASADQLRLGSECDPESLDWLRAESLEIARASNRPAADVFSAARTVRREALELAGRTLRPAQLSELYTLCGQATALMASSAFDLNRWDESGILAKCAASYASLAEHSSLKAWTLGLLALRANWRREPDVALGYFRRGMRIAPRGDQRARLRYIAARSHALIGDTASAMEVLQAARRDQDDADRHPDSLATEIGGEFAFGRARAEACAAAAWLDLGRGREAFEAASSALAELASLPTARRSFSQISGARIDMATACLLRQDLNGGAEALAPLLRQQAAVRNVSLTGRLARALATLRQPVWDKNAQARRLADDICEWLADGPGGQRAIGVVC
jgi:transcriptional regulator with XRE-family HTH domain